MKCNKLLYVIRIMHFHGMCNLSLRDIYNSLVISHLMYGACSWYGLCNNQHKQQIHRIFSRGIKLGYWSKLELSYEQMIDKRSKNLLAEILNNECHLLYDLLLPIKNSNYNMRARTHNRFLPVLQPLHDKRNFVIKMLYETQ